LIYFIKLLLLFIISDVVLKELKLQPFTSAKFQCIVSNLYNWYNITILKNNQHYAIIFSNGTILSKSGSVDVLIQNADYNVNFSSVFDEKNSNCDAEGQYTCTANGVWGSTSVISSLKVSGEFITLHSTEMFVLLSVKTLQCMF